MPVKATITSVKPSGAQWFSDVSAENAAIGKSNVDWSKEQPGFISVTTTNPDENTRIIEYTFDTVENYTAWLQARSNLSSFKTVAEYHTNNNFVTVRHETINQ